MNSSDFYAIEISPELLKDLKTVHGAGAQEIDSVILTAFENVAESIRKMGEGTVDKIKIDVFINAEFSI